MALAFATCLPAAAKEKIQPWSPIDPAELLEAKPSLDPGAAAEVVSWKFDVDDRAFPDERSAYTYVRFKVFDPERAVNVTRLLGFSVAYDGRSLVTTDLRARLTLSDGETREFGKESIQERDTEHEANGNTWYDRLVGVTGLGKKESFLAVTGIKPGAVLEYQLFQSYRPTDTFEYIFQYPEFPIRHFTAKFQLLDDKGSYLDLPYIVNTPKLKVAANADPGTETILLSADGLPALSDEPFSPPVLDRSLALIGSYLPRSLVMATHHDSGQETKISLKGGPWAAIAALTYTAEQDATQPTQALRELASRITAGAANQTEKAHRIHNYVHALLLRFLDSPQRERTRMYTYVSTPLDKVIAFEDNPTLRLHQIDFFWLAVALYRIEGLKTEVLLLPNRARIGFSPNLASEAVVPEHGARVFADGKWQYSVPDLARPEPFGSLPWYTRGYVGLQARPDEVGFVKIPASPAADAVISNEGTLDLAADGSLKGTCRRTWTGEPAVGFKERLRDSNEEDRLRVVGDQLKQELRCEGVTVTGLHGVDDIDAPLVADYQLRWSDFATGTKRLLVFRPSVFHGLAVTPFADAVRQNPIDFEFGWREVDSFDLNVPAGLKLEAPRQPIDRPGRAISYHMGVSFDAGRGQMRVERVFESNLHHLPVAAYAQLKDWFGSMAHDDGAEMVLRKPRAPQPGGTSPQAKSPSAS
jgi:hypothetical protein